MHCIIQGLFFFHGCTPACCLCNSFPDPFQLRFRHKKLQDYLIRIFRIQYGDGSFPGKILYLADAIIVCGHLQNGTSDLLNNGTCPQTFLDSPGIRPHKAACSKKYAAEITCHHHSHIIDLFSQNHVQHRPSRCTGRLSVITASGIFTISPDCINVTVMSGIPVFFLHFFYKSQCLFFCLHRTHGCNKSGFFFCYFSFAAFQNGFITFQHMCSSHFVIWRYLTMNLSKLPVFLTIPCIFPPDSGNAKHTSFP